MNKINTLEGHSVGLRGGYLAEWPTVLLLGAVFICVAGALCLPAGWGGLAVVILIPALTLHSSLSHEILHGHPFGNERAQTLLGLLQPGLFVPYLRFKRLHLEHHKDAALTDPYDDPESNYLDPAVWRGLPGWWRAVLRANNTLAGRVLIGPAVGMWAFIRTDMARLFAGERQIARDWLAHLPGTALILWLIYLSPLSIGAYLLACYGALCVLKIRTFLEHRAHEHAAGRTVIVEDRGPLALLFLNNNFHLVHHMHPDVPWYELPGLYAGRRARYLARNQGYVYPSYASVFRQFLWRAKDPVPHPLWREE
ncbi:MAG: fatty acid desaturase [Sulfitobacter sp.]